MLRSQILQDDRQPARRRRVGFSMVELLVVIAIVVILFSIFVPYVARMREEGRRTACANNLRALHFSLAQYADDNHKNYPQTAADPANPAGYVAFTGAAFVPAVAAAADTEPTAIVASAVLPATAPTTAPTAGTPAVGPAIAIAPPSTVPATGPATSEPAATRPAIATHPARPGPDAVQYNDVTASLWLLVRVAPTKRAPGVSPDLWGYADVTKFVCPSSDETPDPMLTGGRRMRPDQRSNFTSGHHLSYSYCSPFSAYVDASGQRFRMNSDRLNPNFVVMADKSPGVSPANGDDVTAPAYNSNERAFTVANSRNHGRAGQNVLLATGEVVFKNTPYCGYGDQKWPRDNIYTAYAGTPFKPKDGKTTPPGLERNGVYGRNVGPAWEKDSFLVPTDDE